MSLVLDILTCGRRRGCNAGCSSHRSYAGPRPPGTPAGQARPTSRRMDVAFFGPVLLAKGHGRGRREPPASIALERCSCLTCTVFGEPDRGRR